MKVIDDTVNLEQYSRDTAAEAKVRRASSFREKLHAAFAPKKKGDEAPRMLLPKMSGIEFRAGETTAIGGFSGHRKSMLASQIMLDLSVQRRRSLSMSFEMTPAAQVARMARQAAGSSEPTFDQRERFATWTDDRWWLFDHMGRFSTEDTLAVCRYFAVELKGYAVVIDSLMMVCASEEHLDEQKQFATDIARCAQETGLHIFVVTHTRKGDEAKAPRKQDVRGSSAVTDQLDNVLMVWANKPKQDDPTKFANEPDAAVVVDKQRNGKFEGMVKLWWDSASFRFVNAADAPIDPYAFLQDGLGRFEDDDYYTRA